MSPYRTQAEVEEDRVSEEKKESKQTSPYYVIALAAMLIALGAALCGLPWRVACGVALIAATVAGLVTWAKARPRGLTHCAECDSKFENPNLHSGWLCPKCAEKHWDGTRACATKLWRLLQAVEAAAGDNATLTDLAKKRHRYGKAGANGTVAIGLQKTEDDDV